MGPLGGDQKSVAADAVRTDFFGPKQDAGSRRSLRELLAPRPTAPRSRASGTKLPTVQGPFRLKNALPGRAIALRTALQAVYKSRRDGTVMEAVIFLIMLGLFAFVIHEVNDVSSMFGSYDALEDLLFDEEFPGAQYKKNFAEVMTAGEAFSWLQGPVLNGVWPPSKYNDDPLSPALSHYVLNVYRRVGPVQFRQVRVGGASCAVRRFPHLCVDRPNPFNNNTVECMGRFDTLDETCWAQYSKGDESKEPITRNGRTYEWKELNQPLAGLFGMGSSSFGTGGYVTYLGPDRVNASQQLADMVTDEWIDRGTRAISLDWTMYNTETRLATTVRAVIEHDESAFVIAWFRITSFRIASYTGFSNLVRAAAEVAFVVLWLRQIYVLAMSLRDEGFVTWFFSFANLFDLLLAVMQGAYTGTWITYLSSPKLVNFDVNSKEFVSYYAIGELYTQTATFAGVVGLMMMLRLFVFLSLSKRMLTVWLTIQRALPDMLAFTMATAVLIGGFAILGYFLFGWVVRDFHSFVSALTSLLRMALGDFDYAELTQARPQLAPIFFAVFVCVIFLLALTVLIGILTRYFEATHEELKVVDRWKETTPSLESEVVGRWRARCTILYVRCYRCNWQRTPPKESDATGSTSSTTSTPRSPSPSDEDKAPRSGASETRRNRRSRVNRLSVVQQVSMTEDEQRKQNLELEMQMLVDARDELDSLDKQGRFFRAAQRCARTAKRNNAIDLQRYFEDVYELLPNSDRLFITRESLAVIIGKRQRVRTAETVTVHGVTLRRTDLEAASEFVDALSSYKGTQLFGVALEMETPDLRAVSLVQPFSMDVRAPGSGPARSAARLADRLRGRAGGAVVGPEEEEAEREAEAKADAAAITPVELARISARTARVQLIDATGGITDRVLAIDSGHLGLWVEFSEASARARGGEELKLPNGKTSVIGRINPAAPCLAAADATEDAELLVLDLQSRPLRSLPLRLLVHTERHREDPRLGELVFSSKEVALAEEKARGGFNFNLRMRFRSTSERETFLDELLTCASAATALFDNDDDDELDGSGGGDNDDDDIGDTSDVHTVSGDDPMASPARSVAALGRWGKVKTAAKAVKPKSATPKQRRASKMTAAMQAFSRRLTKGQGLLTALQAPGAGRTVTAGAILPETGLDDDDDEDQFDSNGDSLGEVVDGHAVRDDDDDDDAGLSATDMKAAAAAARHAQPSPRSRARLNPLFSVSVLRKQAAANTMAGKR